MGCCHVSKTKKKGEKNITSEQSIQIQLSPALGLDIIHQNIHRFYHLGQTIGVGNFGVVKRSYKLRSSNMIQYAIKSIPKSKLGKHLMFVQRELKLLMTVDHPNIIQLYQIYEDDKYIHLVMELCTGGELFDHLAAKGKYTQAESAQIMYSLLHAISHIHSLNVSHRDLKPQNIMYTQQGSLTELKIVDLGLAKVFQEADENCMNTIVGTPYYIAPEVLKQEYNISCDIWSLGVIMYMLLLGKPPFKGENPSSVLMSVSIGEFVKDQEWEELSQDARDLIEKMLCKNIQERITARQAMEHRWLNKRMRKTTKTIDVSVMKRLKNQQSFNKFKRETMYIISKCLSSSEICSLNDIFRVLDTDHTGYITQSELKKGLKKVGLKTNEQDLVSLIQRIDKAGNGKIDYSEFISSTLDRKHLLDRGVMWIAFKTFDIDNSGYISKSNLSEALTRSGWNVSPSELEFIMKDSHFSNDQIDFQNFCSLFSENQEEISILSEINNRV